MIEFVRSVLAGYEPKRIAGESYRPAAVLIALYEKLGEQHVVLQKRSELVEHHKGEISFPGGARDPGDPDLVTTALREAHEEMGILPDDVEVFGELDGFITVSNFQVTPFVGAIRRTPYEWRLASDEVAAVLEVPVRHLLTPGVFHEEQIGHEGGRYHHGTYTYAEHIVWGATAKMLTGFLDLLRREGFRGAG